MSGGAEAVKYAVVTFGCRVNQADSFVIEEQLRARGAAGVPAEHADVLIVNTCSVTGSADQAARQTIRRIVRSNPDVRVVVTGCYATRRPDDLRELPNVTHVIGNDDKDRLVTLLSDGGGSNRGSRLTFRRPADAAADADGQALQGLTMDGDGPCGQPLAPGEAGRTAFTLRVQTGCDERCSYCIIPTTRGVGRSRALAAVLEDIRRATGAGYREVAITGVHLGSYGRDLGDGTTLTTLVRTLAEWPGEVLFRISSLEPMDCTPALVDLIATSPRLAPHLHLPLQHGSDAMLAAMRRPYTSAYYRTLVDGIRRAVPHAAIGSDVLVGFPGETEGHFSELCTLLDQLPLTHLHVFPYSDRPGTAASALTARVSGSAIRDRGREVRAIGARKAQAFRASQAGSVRRALTVDDGWSAVTDNYFKVRLSEQHPRNDWVEVRIGA